MCAFRLALFASLLFLATTPAMALDPEWRISQYGHSAWRMRDGVFSSSVEGITQTADGYLWIGGEAGLVRFDGVRFVPWKAPAALGPDNRIFHLKGTRDGSLWVATGTGLARIRNDKVVAKFDVGRIGAIEEDPGGDGVWIVLSRIHGDRPPLCHVTDRGLQWFGAGAGIPFQTAQHLAWNTDGSLWIGDVLGVVQWKPPASVTRHFAEALEQRHGLFGVHGIATGSDGTVWASIEEPGAPAAIRQFARGAWSIHPLPRIDDADIAVQSLFVDRDLAVWVGTMTHGIFRFHDGVFDHFGMADGLSGEGTGAFFQDHEGNLWVATTQGLDVFRDLPVMSFSTREGLLADSVSSLVAGADGKVYLGNVGALDVLDHNNVSHIRPRDGLPGQTVTALFADHAGRIWTGVDEGLSLYEHGKFRPILRPDGKPFGFVTVISEDNQHDIWASPDDAFVRIRDLRVQEAFAAPTQIPYPFTVTADPTGGIWIGGREGELARIRDGRVQRIPSPSAKIDGSVLGMVVDRDGSVWAAIQRGLVHIAGNERRVLTMRNGLPCDGHYGLQEDDRDALWLHSRCGLIGIERTELQRWWKSPDTIVKMRVLDPADGMQPGKATFQPSSTKTPDGRLWFANDRIVQMIDPARLDGNRKPPLVHIEQVVADERVLPMQSRVRVPALTRDLQIDYTALSFTQPGKVRFRYRLEPRDRDWHDAQTRRQAFYSDLPPGNYTFE